MRLKSLDRKSSLQDFSGLSGVCADGHGLGKLGIPIRSKELLGIPVGKQKTELGIHFMVSQLKITTSKLW